jgi:hypothetical protein
MQSWASPLLFEGAEVMDDREYQLKQAELVLKEREVSAKEKEGKTSKWFNPVTIAIYVAAIGLFGNIYTNYSNNGASDKIERVRAQSSLVLSVIKTNGNEDDACKNLNFFVKIGWLEDPNGAIHNVCGAKGEGGVPTLPAVEAGGSGGDKSGYGQGGYGQGGYGGKQKFTVIAHLPVRVEDADSHEPIENAKIIRVEDSTSRPAVTDAVGITELDFVNSRTNITVTKDGYERTTLNPLAQLGKSESALVVRLHRAATSKH